MKIHRVLCMVALIGLLLAGQATQASAADIRVLCSNGLKAVFEELAPQFERTSGHKVVVTYGLAAGFKQQIDSGTAFDVAILTPVLIDDLIKSGKMAADSRTVIARTGLGIMIKAGARKPDVRTTDSFKKSLLDASAIAYAKEGASGVAFAALIEKLGLAGTLQPRLKPTATGEEVNNLVVSGGAQYGTCTMSALRRDACAGNVRCSNHTLPRLPPKPFVVTTSTPLGTPSALAACGGKISVNFVSGETRRRLGSR